MGNIRSVYNALKHLGVKPIIASTTSQVKSGKIVIPGVGAYGKGMKNLKPFIPKIRETLTSNFPILGICLGMQMFFEGSEESLETKGLGLMKGKVVRIRTNMRLPHIGWNYLKIRKKECPLFDGVDNGYVYFVHSYHVLPEEDVIAATSNHGCEINVCVWKKNIFGTQFHLEKSGALGLRILKNFLEL
jgi:glutamine amidotransferase